MCEYEILYAIMEMFKLPLISGLQMAFLMLKSHLVSLGYQCNSVQRSVYFLITHRKPFSNTTPSLCYLYLELIDRNLTSTHTHFPVLSFVQTPLIYVEISCAT